MTAADVVVVAGVTGWAAGCLITTAALVWVVLDSGGDDGDR